MLRILLALALVAAAFYFGSGMILAARVVLGTTFAWMFEDF